MQNLFLTLLMVLSLSFSSRVLGAATTPTPSSNLMLAKNLLQTVRDGGKTKDLEKQLAGLEVDALAEELDTDAKRKAFWINIYNSYIVILLKDKPELYENRGDFFSSKRVTIAGEELSFDDIEHGFIRKSRVKLGLGLIPNLFPGKLERKFRVKEIDPRIHFALNCGAKACPPVRIYDADEIDEQLDASSRQYLKKITKYDKEAEKVSVTPLMSWFRGDFKGKKGIRKMLQRYEVIPEGVKPSIEYLSYDWTLDIDNFVE